MVKDPDLWPVQVRQKSEIYHGTAVGDEENARYWNKPVNDRIKIIDFGGATYNRGNNDHIITTETYRAPEVILECQCWDEKSDIWSMGCILIEIYTGEIFYDADEYVEHLAMIEK